MSHEGYMRILAAPYFWYKAIRDHKHAVSYAYLVRGTPEWDRACDATWEPFQRVFEHMIPAFIMTLIYGLMAVAIVVLVVE